MEEEVINSYLTFTVNGSLYGVHVAKVVEILAYEKPQAQAGSVPYILGLVTHRGHVLPLIDSGVKFDVGKVNLSEQTYVVVITIHGKEADFDVALAVDEVREVIEIPVENRKYIDTTYKPGYVSFATDVQNRLALVIDPDKVFTDAEVFSMSKVVVLTKTTADEAL